MEDVQHFLVGSKQLQYSTPLLHLPPNLMLKNPYPQQRFSQTLDLCCKLVDKCYSFYLLMYPCRSTSRPWLDGCVTVYPILIGLSGLSMTPHKQIVMLCPSFAMVTRSPLQPMSLQIDIIQVATCTKYILTPSS